MEINRFGIRRDKGVKIDRLLDNVKLSLLAHTVRQEKKEGEAFD